MTPLRYTLHGDGPTEERLLPILNWLLSQYLPEVEIRPQFADPRLIPNQTPYGLADKLREVLKRFPCDLLFVHRDAEREPVEARVQEIADAIEIIAGIPRHIPVVPVRMSEAWLLIDERAIRQAAGNPNGRQKLKLPSTKSLEKIPDPKETLQELLREACGLNGRRLKSFRAQSAMYQLAYEIDDFAPLRELTAFQRLERLVSQFATDWLRQYTEG